MGLWWAVLAGTVGLTAPALAVRLLGVRVGSAPLEALLYGLGVFGAAFLLAWAAEAAQKEISRGLALAALALVAVLPEYSVDLYFAWRAAHNPEYVGYVAANMTGANRILIGVGWPLVVLLYWWRTGDRQVPFQSDQRVASSFLALAAVYVFLLPLKGSISLVDAAILIVIFATFMWRSGQLERAEAKLRGPARLIGDLPPVPRRAATIGSFVFAGVVILLSAEPFAEALVASGRALGISEFLLVQWLAPLASESPEIIAASLFALQCRATAGLGALLSSKVNQWTLLVGTLPIVFSLGAGHFQALPLDRRQQEVLFLTSAQTLFAVTLLLDLHLSLAGAGLLVALFLVQFFFPRANLPVTRAYLVLAAVAGVRSRRQIIPLLREGVLGQRSDAGGDRPRQPRRSAGYPTR